MTPYERHAAERERDGMDFANHVYDAVLHRWVYKPIPMTDREAELEDMRAEAAAEARAERARWDDEYDNGYSDDDDEADPE